MTLLRALLHRLSGERGQTLVEYSLIILLVAVALVLSLGVFSTGLDGFYQKAAGAFP